MKKFFLLSIASLCFMQVLAPQASASADFPSKSVTMINPYSAGGGSDLRCRIIAEVLQRNWDETINVLSMPGGAGATGMLRAKKARPDGYTIILSSLGPATITPNRVNVGYNTPEDFIPIAKITSSRYVVAVHKDSGITSFKELLEKARAAKGDITFGTPGAGLGQHLMFSDLLDRIPDITMQHIPFNGASDTNSALLGQHINAAIMIDSDVLPHVLSKDVLVLAVTGTERSQMYPDIPTFAELGFETAVSGSWNGFMVRKGVDAKIVQKLQDGIADALRDPDVMERFKKAQIVIDYEDSASFTKTVQAEYAHFKKILSNLPQ